MQIKTRIIYKQSGPHVGRKEFLWAGKWHFLKWISKHEKQNKEKTNGNSCG